MRMIEMIMGMPVSIDIPDATPGSFTPLFDFFRQVDEHFSPYRQTSEVSQFALGQIDKAELSPELMACIEQCERYRTETDGYFSAYYAGSFDPSGYVKAWAINQAGLMITASGFSAYLINVAGDILAHGDQKRWNLAVQDPFDRQAILGMVHLTNEGMATSGSYVRGAHIFDPHTKDATSDVISATVLGADIVTADVYATVCVAMGFEKATAFLSEHPTYAALLVRQDGEMLRINFFRWS